ncbi:MAG: hypothetical protein AABZ77_02110, partial [Chloroflexota bacterium]
VAASVEVNSGATILLVPNESRGSIPLAIKGIPGSGNSTGVRWFTFSLSWNKNVIQVDNITASTIAGFNIPAVTPNNNTGTANITGNTSGSYLVGNTIVANLVIRAVGSVGDNTSINVTVTSLIDNNLNPISATSVNSTVAIQPTALVTISVVLQGGQRPDAGWVVPLAVKFFTPGVDVMTATPIYTFTENTTKVGSTAAANVSSIIPGTYDITVKSAHTLLNVKRNVVILSPSTAVNMGTLLEGNAKEDTLTNASIINIFDFGVLSGGWNKLSTDVGFDSQADFDRNGIVNIFDFGLLSGNWNKVAPITVP